MADVRPLPGIRYADAAHLAALVTPPYDVISPEAQARYYERDPHNIIRLELGAMSRATTTSTTAIHARRRPLPNGGGQASFSRTTRRFTSMSSGSPAAASATRAPAC